MELKLEHKYSVNQEVYLLDSIWQKFGVKKMLITAIMPVVRESETFIEYSAQEVKEGEEFVATDTYPEEFLFGSLEEAEAAKNSDESKAKLKEHLESSHGRLKNLIEENNKVLSELEEEINKL